MLLMNAVLSILLLVIIFEVKRKGILLSHFQHIRVLNLNHRALSPPGGAVPELQSPFKG